MAVKMRLQRHGSKKRPFYFIVVADARAPRDGKFIQKIGTYNPLTVPATIQLDRQKALEWLHKGAKFTADDSKVGVRAGDGFTRELLGRLIDEEYAKLRAASNRDVHNGDVQVFNGDNGVTRVTSKYSTGTSNAQR